VLIQEEFRFTLKWATGNKITNPFENSVVIGHWHKKKAKVTAIKQQKSK
jgi:hypothetical protein